MGRGPHLKTQAKKERMLSKARAKGSLQGNAEWKNTKAGWMHSLREHIGKMIDRVDPIKAIAIVSTTLLVYEVLSQAEDFLDSLKVLTPMGITFFRIFGFKPVGKDVGLGFIPEEKETPYLLAISLMIAYIIIEHPEAIVATAKGILGFAQALIPLAGALPIPITA